MYLNMSINKFNSHTRRIIFLLSSTCITANSVSTCGLAVVVLQTFIYVLTMDDVNDSVAWST